MSRNVDSQPAPGSASLLTADPHALFLEGVGRLIAIEHRVLGGVADGESLVSEAL